MHHKKQNDSLYIEATGKHGKPRVTRKSESSSNEEHPVIEQIITEDWELVTWSEKEGSQQNEKVKPTQKEKGGKARQKDVQMTRAFDMHMVMIYKNLQYATLSLLLLALISFFVIFLQKQHKHKDTSSMKTEITSRLESTEITLEILYKVCKHLMLCRTYFFRAMYTKKCAPCVCA